MIGMPGFFFTALDDSLRPRGSRDPLGLEYVWSQVGRRMVGNLTTVTRHLDNFTLALVGFRLCMSSDTDVPLWHRFERYEQIVARACYMSDVEGILGSRKIATTKDLDPVPLGKGREARILEGARRSGLWGIYASALTVTGLTDSRRRLRRSGMELADAFIAALPDVDWLRNTLSEDIASVPRQELESFSKGVKQMLFSSARADLAEQLLGGDKASAWQAELRVQTKNYLDREGENSATVPALLNHLASHSPVLGKYAARVIELEAVLVFADRVFAYLLASHGQPLSKVLKDLAPLEHWPGIRNFAEPSQEGFGLSLAWKNRTKGLGQVVMAARKQDWAAVVHHLLAHHAQVMDDRSGPPWCFLENDVLKVIYGEGGRGLPTSEEMQSPHWHAWSNSYFLGSYLAVMAQARRTEERLAV